MLVKAPIPGNSLGRAKGPCHNCSESTLECDGQRPRCFTCVQNRIECRGYKMDLPWQSGVATRGNLKGFQYPTVQSPIKRTAKAPGNASLDESAPKGRKPLNGEFKFVTGRPAKRRKARQQTGQSHFNIGASPKAATESPATTEYGPPSLESAALVQSPYISSAPSPGMSL
jgi:hypothetical protein